METQTQTQQQQNTQLNTASQKVSESVRVLRMASDAELRREAMRGCVDQVEQGAGRGGQRVRCFALRGISASVRREYAAHIPGVISRIVAWSRV